MTLNIYEVAFAGTQEFLSATVYVVAISMQDALDIARQRVVSKASPVGWSKHSSTVPEVSSIKLFWRDVWIRQPAP